VQRFFHVVAGFAGLVARLHPELEKKQIQNKEKNIFRKNIL